MDFFYKQILNFPHTQLQGIHQINNSLTLAHQVQYDMENLTLQSFDQNDFWKIAKILQILLSDQKLYQNKTLKHKLKNSKNGWIPIEDILSTQSLHPIFNQISGFKKFNKKSLTKLLHIHFVNFKSGLKTNKRSIRRKCHFVDKTKNVKPIHVYNCPTDNEMLTMRNILQNVSEIYSIKWNLGSKSAYVYAQKPEVVVEFFQNQNFSQNEFQQDQQRRNRIQAVTYEDLLKRAAFTREIEQKFLVSMLKLPYVNSLIEYKINETTQNFSESTQIMNKILEDGLYQVQNIRRFQVFRQIQNKQIRQIDENVFLNGNFDLRRRQQNQNFRRRQQNQNMRRSEEHMYCYQNNYDYSNQHQNRINCNQNKLKRKQQSQRINGKINSIITDIKTYYLPNYEFNQRFLKKNGRQYDSDGKEINVRSKNSQNYDMIDFLLNEKFSKIIQI